MMEQPSPSFESSGRDTTDRSFESDGQLHELPTPKSDFGAGVSGSTHVEAADAGTGRSKSRRRSRGGKKVSRRKAARAGSSESGESASDRAPADASKEAPADSGEAGSKKKRSRRSRGRKAAASDGDEKAKTKSADDGKKSDSRPASDDAQPAEAEGGAEGGAKRRRRRGSRGGKRRGRSGSAAEVELLPGEEDDLAEVPVRAKAKKDEAKESKPQRKRARSKKKASKATAKTEEGGRKKRASRKRKETAAKVAEEDKPSQLILVNAIDREEKRVAVVEDGQIVDFLMTAESQKTLVNDIYRGKVVNLESAIGAAFVDFGQGRNGFLHTSDVLPVYGEKGFTLSSLLTAHVDPDDWDDESDRNGSVDEIEEAEEETSGKGRAGKDRGQRRRLRQRLPIDDLVKVGSEVVVQVTKDAIGDKGPTLTTYISIPGRYLVLMPSMARTGVSRKIPDEKERRRLKRILSSLDTPRDMGVIVRTAGVGRTKTDLQRDLDYLLGVWETFGKRLKSGRGPAPLYQESDMAIRTLRDLFGERTEAVMVDDPTTYDQLIAFAEKLMPEQIDRIKLHDGVRPIFHHYGIEQDFEKIFARRVELPSGGSIVFDQTEALVAIDVNSGRTRTGSHDFEEIALKTNLEAVPEIARQIRLRDLGGILVCDFIDMTRSSSMRTVERALRAALADDRARSKMGRVSQFGLLEMTRQRLGPGTHKKVFQICPRCRGTAQIRTVPSRAAAILRRLGSALTQKGFTSVEVRAHPEVVEYLREDLYDYVRALEHRTEKEIELTPVAEQPEDSVLRFLRADGREVRPGGRRKR